MAENASNDQPVIEQDFPSIASALSAVEHEEQRLRKAIEDQLQQRAQADRTARLTKEEVKLLPDAARLPFGTQLASAIDYVKLPAKPSAQKAEIRWRIELHGLTRSADPVGIDVVGDVVLGRSVGVDEDPDFDLEPFNAFQMGVSRRHALLRPTRNCLYIIDLNSTNGTLYNALRIGSGVTRAILHNDTLTLGQLSFTVKIIERPLEPRADSLSSASGDVSNVQDDAKPHHLDTLTDVPSGVLVSSDGKKDAPVVREGSPATHP
jgi:hypothetical protein